MQILEMNLSSNVVQSDLHFHVVTSFECISKYALADNFCPIAVNFTKEDNSSSNCASDSSHDMTCNQSSLQIKWSWINFTPLHLNFCSFESLKGVIKMIQLLIYL